MASNAFNTGNPAAPNPATETPSPTPVDASAGIGDISLHKAFSALQESLSKLFDERGVTRAFSVPYIEGQATSEHIAAVNRAAQPSGGFTKNLLTTAHHAGGKGWGSGDGSTVGHPVDKLQETVIPPDDQNAIAALHKAQALVNHFKTLLGENNQQVKTAQSQLDLIKHNNAAGMTLFDFGVALQQLPSASLQAISRAHHATKSRAVTPKLRSPRA
jgi:hypothetical protein